MPQESESGTTKQFLQDAEDQQQEELNQQGVNDPYQLWRESMPNTRIEDNAVLDTFMQSQEIETAAQDGTLQVVTGEPEPEAEEITPPEPVEGEEPPEKDPTALTPIPGMWMPPEESRAENYEEPTTSEMVASDEWYENAHKFWEFMGSPNIHQQKRDRARLGRGPGTVDDIMGRPVKEMTDDEISEWAESRIASFNWNLLSTATLGHKIMSSNDPEGALAALNLMNMYDFSDGGWYEFGRAIGNLALDPTTYLGLGVGTLASKGTAKLVAKEGLSRAVQGAIITGTAGTVEGTVLAGGFDLVKQEVEKEAGARDETDLGQTAKHAAMGAAFGLVLGGGGGYLAGRYADKFAAAVDEELSRQLGGSRRETAIAMQEMTADELFQMLTAAQRAQELQGGQVDDAAQMALRLLGNTDELPRTPDGNIDMDAVANILDDAVLTREQRTAAAEARIAESERLLAEGADTPVGGRRKTDDLDVSTDTETGEIVVRNDNGDYSVEAGIADEMGIKVAMQKGSEGADVLVIKDASPEVQDEFVKRLQARQAVLEEIVDTGKTQTGRIKMADVIEKSLLDDPDNPNIDEVNELYDQIAGEMGMQIDAMLEAGHRPVVKALGADDVMAMQRHVDADPGPTEKGILEGYDDKPIIYEQDGKHYILDGHHRFDEAAKAGDTVEAYVFDVPAEVIDAMNAGRAIPDNVLPFPVGRTTPEPPFVPTVAKKESVELAKRLVEMDELSAEQIVLKGPGRPGSIVMDSLGKRYELVGRTKNGWYRAINNVTGEEANFRRKDFSIDTAQPVPTKAGVQSLAPLDDDAARIVAMAEAITDRPLEHVTITHAQTIQLAKQLEDSGIDITAKELMSRWTEAETYFLMNTYNAMGKQLLQFAKGMKARVRRGERIPDSELAYFNAAHAKFMATRDLFYGVKGDAARQMNILQARPKDEAYDFSDTLMDLISQKGGRNNTERAIMTLAELGDDDLAGLTRKSEKLWDNKIASAILNVRYNMMLSSWRTHFFNFLGNSASGIWELGIISPGKMAINNWSYARETAWHHMTKNLPEDSYIKGRLGNDLPDPAQRLRMRSWGSEWQGHYAAFQNSLFLAKEIALGRDIGEGKVWNELGLRYDVINVPQSAFGKMGTTPVRALEAGDAFFKNQYFNSKLHFLAERRARAESIHDGLDFETRFNYWLKNYDGPMEREAKAYAAKLTYTNDPNVYGGILATVAKMIQTGQSRSLFINWLVPFVRTPANLLSYSMEQIGANTILSPSKTWADFNSPDQLIRHEAQSRLMAAAGLWAVAHSLYERGLCTGVGPSNWEERRAWENAGWQANSCKIGGQWVDLSRAAPAGQSINTMMSVFDFFALNHDQTDGPPEEWMGQFLLYTGDLIKDESYLSTITDYIAAVESKEQSRAQAIVASTVNSFLVPNLMRDIRRTTDEGVRTTAADNPLDAVLKQMKNAWPGYSEGLPPSRDGFGRPKDYWSNGYMDSGQEGAAAAVRGVVPFNIKDPELHGEDDAAMAIAYARVPMSVPPKSLSLPGRSNFMDLLAMDQNAGFVYDKYIQFVGESRHELTKAIVESQGWEKLILDGEAGPGGFGDSLLRQAMAKGHQLGKARFIQFLIDTEQFETGGPPEDSQLILIQHQFSKEEYREMMKLVLGERGEVPEDFPQYDLLERGEGPEFFKPK